MDRRTDTNGATNSVTHTNEVRVRPVFVQLWSSSSPTHGDMAGSDMGKLGLFIFGWYAFNAGFNVTNKQILNQFNFAWIVSWLQLAPSRPDELLSRYVMDGASPGQQPTSP